MSRDRPEIGMVSPEFSSATVVRKGFGDNFGTAWMS